MSMHPLGRREFLMTMMAAGAAGFARAGAAYDPAASFDVAVTEVVFRRNAAGRMLMARVYQPKGAGPYSTCTAAHGTRRIATLKSRWIVRLPRAACWWWRST